MTTKTLIGIIETRIASSEGNPTSKSFFYELHKALERLDAYESGEKHIGTTTEQDIDDFLND